MNCGLNGVDVGDDNFDIVETQPDEIPTQVASQESRLPEEHLWGYLIPCNPKARRLDFMKAQLEYRIGRNKSVGNDFVLPGMKVSNAHCIVKWDGRTDRGSVVQIVDLSSNGTFINGDLIGKGRFGILKEGHEVAFGTARPQPGSTEDYRYIYRHMGAGTPTSGLYANYELTEELGKGSFATVMKAMSKSSGRWYACKMILKKQLRASATQKGKEKPKDPEEALMKEVKILECLQHRNICQLKEVFTDDHYINIILEYIPGGDLLDYIVARHGLHEQEAKHITYQICDALAYIHSKGIAHRDLKPENVLLTDDVPPVVKVADFGLAKAIDSLTMLRTMCGTPSYLAPEVVTQGEEEGYQQIVDSWSVGVIVFSMLTNTNPFIEPENVEDVKLRIVQRTIDWNTLHHSDVSSEAIKFIENLLIEDPKMRLSLADALTHPWLLPLKDILNIPAEREATASPRAAPVPLPLADVRPMSIDKLAATVSPQYAIPGAYPASQPDRTLQRRRKVLDDARETGHKMPEPSPEMIQRVEQMMRKDQTPEVPERTVTRGTKRKASTELSTAPMDEDEPLAGPSGQAETTVQDEAPAPARNGRVRRGKTTAAAAPAAPRTRARTRGTPVDDGPAEATRRRSTRHK